MRIATDGAAHPGIERRRFLELVAPIAALLIVAGGPARGQDAPAPGILARSVLGDVQFRGRSNVGLAAIEAASGLKKGAVVDVFLVEQGVQEIVKLYREKGYPTAEVKLVEGNHPGDSRVIIEIIEGPKAVANAPASPATLPTPNPPVASGDLLGHKAFSVDDAFLTRRPAKANDPFPPIIVVEPGTNPTILPIPVEPPGFAESGRHLERASGALEDGDLQRALDEATAAVRLVPEVADVYRCRGEIYTRMGLHRRAIADFSEALRLGQNARYYLARGYAYCQDRDFERGFSDIDMAFFLSVGDKDRALALVWRGSAHQLRGDHASAVADFDRAIDQGLGGPEVYGPRGQALAALGEHGRAIADLDRVIAIQPSPDAFALRGDSRFAQGDPAAAEADHERALVINPEFARSYSGRGLSRLVQGFVDEAIVDFNQAIEIDPQFARAFTGRGWAYLAKHDLEHAIADFDEAIGLQPIGRLWGFVQFGIDVASDPCNDRAIAEFAEHCRLHPDRLGWWFFLRGQEARSALLNNPDFAFYLVRRPDGRPGVEPDFVFNLMLNWEYNPEATVAYAGRAIAAFRQADWDEAEHDAKCALMAWIGRNVPGLTKPSFSKDLRARLVPLSAVISPRTRAKRP